MADRGMRGTMPAATERDDESYLAFVQSLRSHTLRAHRDAAIEAGKSAVAAWERATGRKADRAVYRDALDQSASVQVRNRLMRSHQEMMWNGIIDTYRKRHDELVAALDRASLSGPGSVEVDPGFVYPAYYDDVAFHIQPGSYHREPLAGYIYHYGLEIFTQGASANDDLHRKMVQLIPAPRDGEVRRVLDLGCTIGQTTTALKERFPTAEVIGIDAAAPMVRYSHHRAAALGLDVHFKQRLAEATGFPGGAFDLVFAFILFHEIPREIASEVIAEAHRVLRPGGLFVVVDFPNRDPNGTPDWADYARDFDADFNGEPYSVDFVYRDFGAQLRQVFAEVVEDWQPSPGQPMRVCIKG
ncbi:MAG: class I SAM-dependent methyltransferase [Dehalococcoidia bacterium]